MPGAQCIECGRKVREDENFCPHCGAQFVVDDDVSASDDDDGQDQGIGKPASRVSSLIGCFLAFALFLLVVFGFLLLANGDQLLFTTVPQSRPTPVVQVTPAPPPINTATMAPQPTRIPTGGSTKYLTDTPQPSATPLPTSPPASAKSGANLRAGPGTNYPIVSSVTAGQTLVIVGRNTSGDWYRLNQDPWILDKDQWIFADLVSNPPEVPVMTMAPAPTATKTPRPPGAPSDAVWCATSPTLGVCAGAFRSFYYTINPGTTFVAFVLKVYNGGRSATQVNPLNVTVVDSQGNTHSYDAVTYTYWNSPLDAVDVLPGNSAQGGLVFKIGQGLSLVQLAYQPISLFEGPVIVNLTGKPTSGG